MRVPSRPIFARVAQLDRASASGAEGRGFESRRAHLEPKASSYQPAANCCRRLRALALGAALISPVAAGAQAQTSAFRPDTATLRRTLDSLVAAHHGTVGYAVIDVETGASLSARGDETFPTASLIKVPILVTVYDLYAGGRLSPDDRLTVLKIDKVPGSGILQHLHDGMVITVADAAWLMATISDNTATNLLLDRIIIRRVWDKMEALGLRNTKVHSKSFLRSSSVAMDSSVKYGLGVTTPNEMARLFQLLAEGKAVSPAADSAMLSILENGDDYRTLQRFAGNVRSARKTGLGDTVRTECSLFYLRHRVVACVLTKDNADRRWILDNEPNLTMARMGEAIVAAWPK
jgi:beta-lactamase class A